MLLPCLGIFDPGAAVASAISIQNSEAADMVVQYFKEIRIPAISDLRHPFHNRDSSAKA